MNVNSQLPEKKVFADGRTLMVNNIFFTIQGEGPFAGWPAVFIRLAGCNLQCPGCDTLYTYRQETEVGEILQLVKEAAGTNKHRVVVITGGEPFRQPLHRLVALLLSHGYQVQLETNGTLFQILPYGLPQLTVVCSPKTGSINAKLLPYISALKYVVDADSVGEDGYPDLALGNGRSRLARPPMGFRGPIYFQPFDSGNPEENKRHQQAALAAAFKTGGIYCHQLHKLLDLE